MKILGLVLMTFVLWACGTSEVSLEPSPTPDLGDTTEVVEEPVVEVLEPVIDPLDAYFPLKDSAPDLDNLGAWLNSEPVESLEELKGKVVLVNFWTFGCANCIATFKHVQGWQEAYADQGLVILGLHRPEFKYEYDLKNLKKAVADYGLTFPIAQDNDASTWRAYKNRYWPAFYLIDQEGYIRYRHFGEGKYDLMVQNIEKLLAR